MKLEITALSLPLDEFSLQADLVIDRTPTAIFGPSGAGKTSLLEVIAGLRRPALGKIQLDGELFENASERYSRPIRSRNIGYVPQDDSLFPHLSVRRNLLYGDRMKSKEKAFSLEHVLDFLSIGGLLERDVGSLSRGEKQRVTIARALLSNPRLLLLDEPLTALDLKLKMVVLEQLRALQTEFGVPMLFVTHDAAEAKALCQEVILLDRGRVTGRGAPAELLSSLG